MALDHRIAALHKRHEWLDQVLVEEKHHPHPDEIRMAQIKKSKLRVKDEISALQKMQHDYLYPAHQQTPQKRTGTRH